MNEASLSLVLLIGGIVFGLEPDLVPCSSGLFRHDCGDLIGRNGLQG
jgi:hypothetical protein